MDKQGGRRVLGIVFAPLIVPIVMTIWLHKGGLSDEWLSITLAVATLFSYFGFIVFGMPAEIILRKKGIINLWAAMLLGAMAGGVTWLLFSVLFALFLGEGWWGVKFVFTDIPSMLKGQALGGGLGTIVGLVYWLLSRPDKTNSASGA